MGENRTKPIGVQILSYIQQMIYVSYKIVSYKIDIKDQI